MRPRKNDSFIRGFPKQGEHSVGVGQYCGSLGKVDRCQVGVFLAYTRSCHVTLIDRRLHLPEEWAEDRERRQRVGVPEDVPFKTKAELVLEMILDAGRRRLCFGWVGMAAHYGEQSLGFVTGQRTKESSTWPIFPLPIEYSKTSQRSLSQSARAKEEESPQGSSQILPRSTNFIASSS